MHASVHAYVERIGARLPADARGRLRVLEVGSLNVNGSIRDVFANVGTYVGVDRLPGLGVDRVVGERLPFADEAFDVVVSTEALEHDAQFWVTLVEMVRVLCHDGRLIVTARGNGFPEHGEPGRFGDYYRFLPAGFSSLLQNLGLRSIEVEEDAEAAGVFATGVKP